MIRLVEDITWLSHPDEGAEDIKRVEVDLFAPAEQTVNTLRAEAETTRVRVRLSGEPTVIAGIAQLLRSNIFKFCDSTIRYNREGGSAAGVILHKKAPSRQKERMQRGSKIFQNDGKRSVPANLAWYAPFVMEYYF